MEVCRRVSAVSKALVLIVEDEPLLRLHAVALVEEFGFDTLQAGTADEAILLLETDARIRAVFTDIDLPGSMDGLRLARAVRDRWPPVELILTSGHFKITPADLPERGQFLSKPYSDEQLRHAFDAVHL
ncbi:MAG: response regulator [Proteobacteria bacterium]|nr:response regulator [Pseudomonadota bacterium]MBS0549300.1 response regulator [Pseudomonadota bacterium]